MVSKRSGVEVGNRATDLVHEGTEIPVRVFPGDMHPALGLHIQGSAKRHSESWHGVYSVAIRGVVDREPPIAGGQPGHAEISMDGNELGSMVSVPARQRDHVVPGGGSDRVLQSEPRLGLGLLLRAARLGLARAAAHPPGRVRRAAAAVLEAGGDEDAVALVSLTVAAVVYALAAEGSRVVALFVN